jgi:hypothetical protein
LIIQNQIFFSLESPFGAFLHNIDAIPLRIGEIIISIAVVQARAKTAVAREHQSRYFGPCIAKELLFPRMQRPFIYNNEHIGRR